MKRKDYSIKGQLTLSGLVLWSGKMSLEPSAATKEKTSDVSSKKRQKWSKGMPAFLDLRAANGHIPNASWEMGGALLGEYTMHSFGEYPSVEKESRLSQILEAKPHPKYCLSAKACQGIIRRAEKRGKVLPPMLDQALRRQAASRVGGHVYENDVAGTVRANAGDNQQAVVYGISAYESNAMKSGNPNSGIYEAETSRTLDLNGGSPACNQGGMAVVCLEGNGSRPSHKGDGFVESDTMYTLNSTEHHAVCIENHPADSRVKISEDGVVQNLSSRMGTDGGNVPMVMEEPYNATTGSFMRAGNSGIAETPAARDYKDPQIVCNSVVRRLTPLECERLQGYPDGWTDIGDWVDSKGKKHKGESDAPRYKALGNSIALPFWEWMAGRMVKQLKQDGFENPTMASLFDGIGGFPLVFSRNGCKPMWASEIEEFPIAVTKIRFSGESEQ